MDSVSVTGTSVTVTGLNSGTEYFFRVVATNAGDESPASSQVSTPTLVPGFVVFRDALSGGGEGPQMVVLPTGGFSMRP